MSLEVRRFNCDGSTAGAAPGREVAHPPPLLQTPAAALAGASDRPTLPSFSVCAALGELPQRFPDTQQFLETLEMLAAPPAGGEAGEAAAARLLFDWQVRRRKRPPQLQASALAATFIHPGAHDRQGMPFSLSPGCAV